MKILKVLAAPYQFEGTYVPHWAASKEANAAKLELLLKTAKQVATYSATGVDLEIMKANDDGDDFYFVCAIVGNDQALIQYGVKVRHYKISGKFSVRTCGQVSVYRNKGFSASSGLPAWVFKHILYPKYKKILSDSSKSTDGKDFWYSRITEALGQGKKVFALEIETTGEIHDCKSVVPIKSLAETFPFYSTGEDYSGYHYRFLIED